MVYTVAASEGRTTDLPVGESQPGPLLHAGPFPSACRQPSAGALWLSLPRDAHCAHTDTAVLVPITTGGQLLAVWSANASAVYLAFSSTAQTLSNVTAHDPLEQDAFYDALFSAMGNGSFNAVAADPFRGLLGPPGQNGLTSVGSARLRMRDLELPRRKWFSMINT